MRVRVTSTVPHFVFGDSDIELGQDIDVDSVTVFDPWTLEASITIESDAPLGPRDATLLVDNTVEVLPEAFTVVAESLEVVPASGRMGELLEVELFGDGTTWDPGRT